MAEGAHRQMLGIVCLFRQVLEEDSGQTIIKLDWLESLVQDRLLWTRQCYSGKFSVKTNALKLVKERDNLWTVLWET